MRNVTPSLRVRKLNNMQMKRFLTIIIFSFFVCSFFMLAQIKSAFPDTTQDKLKSEKSKLKSLSDEEENILTDLVTIESSIKLKDKEIKLLNERIDNLNNELIPLKHKAEKANKSFIESQTVLEHRLKNIYKYGQTNVFEVIFSAKNLNDLVNRISYLNKIAKLDKKILIQNEKKKLELEQIQKELKNKQDELQSTKDYYQDSKDNFLAKKGEKNNFLAKLRQDKSKSQEIIDNLEAQAAAVQNRMARLQTPSRGGISGVPTGSLRMLATGYCPDCGNGNGRTASGLKAGYGIAAVDPAVIPLGTKLSISGYGKAIAADTGGAIKGNRIDLCFNTHAEANAFGKKWVIVTILD